MHLFDACVAFADACPPKATYYVSKRCTHTSLLTHSRSLFDAKSTYYVSKEMHACVKSGGR